MIRIRIALATVALGAAMTLPLAADAEIFRYDDENGNRHLVNSINDVPEEYRKQALSDFEGRKGGGEANLVEGMDTEIPAAASNVAPAASSDPSHIGGYDRYWWQAQMEKKQERVDDLQGQLDKKNAGRQKTSDSITGNSGPAREKDDTATGRQWGGAGLRDNNMTVDKIEGLLAEAHTDLDKFKKRARQEGVPPGWLR